jgi:cytochrome c biogenesis protein
MRHAPQSEVTFEDLPEENVFQAVTDFNQAADATTMLLKKKYGHVERADKANGVFLCAQKGRFSLFGVYLVHLSILVLIAGAMIGAFFGVEAYVNIAEGETVSAIQLRSNDQTLALPFFVHCDKFTVEFYKNDMPKTYQSDLTFIKDNQVIHSVKLRVNHPIEFEGFSFYQSSYATAPGGKATLALLRDGGQRDVMNIARGYDFDLPGKEGSFRVLRVEADLMKMGPAIKVAVRSNKNEEGTFWVFQQIDKIKAMNPDIITQVPMFNPALFRPYTFTLLGMEVKYVTGLQVNRDPGAPVVAAAAVLLICGLMLILFSYTRSVFIRIDQKDDKIFVTVAGKSYKNQAGLQKEIQYLIAELKNNLEKSK